MITEVIAGIEILDSLVKVIGNFASTYRDLTPHELEVIKKARKQRLKILKKYVEQLEKEDK